jgi:hypothetical protein
MPVVSVTRIRIRSWRFMVPFTIYSMRAVHQIRRSPGFLGGWVGRSRGGGMWTVTVWTDEAAMKNYRDHDAHKAAMPGMLDWGDEGSMARYEQAGTQAPTAAEARDALAARGRTSKVRYPTAEHAAGKPVPDGRAPFIGRVLRAV